MIGIDLEDRQERIQFAEVFKHLGIKITKEVIKEK